MEALTGETPEISQYLGFGFYNRVWLKKDAGLGETKLGIFLGVSHHIGSLMSYWVFPARIIPMSRTTVQRVTNLESQTEQCEERFEFYDRAIADIFNEIYIEGNFVDTPNNKPNIERWEDLAGDDKIFYDVFARMITTEYILESDDIFDPEEFDYYVNMELALGRHEDGPEFDIFNRILKDKDGRQIVIVKDNPILDTRMYKVEYSDGYKTSMTANAIASKLFSQVNQDVKRF